MQFSWKGLLLAPLVVPALFSGAFAGLATLDSGPDQHSLLGFLILLIPGCIVSYGATILLLLPSLYVLSRWRRMTWLSVCLLGAALGLLVFVLVTALEWKSSGPDSGPPAEHFAVFLLLWAADPLTLVYPIAALVTTALYWWFGGRQIAAPGAVPKQT
jgi:hypothetical protein